METIVAAQALLPDGWAHDVRITIEDRRIVAVEPGATPAAGETRHTVAIPGMPNLHSHAFQRGMAGRAEIRGQSADTFWTWREVMYHFALTMSPDQMEAVASQAYVEMLESGFSRVGEFHYVHHDREGSPYADIAEMATRIAAAADKTGIGLTLLPVFYAHSTFGGASPTDGQRRFITDMDAFARLVDRCHEIARDLDGAVVGVAPHSLRAVTPEELAAVVALQPTGPIHIHVAEQLREVEDCLAWSGQRPLSWLLDHAGVDARWCLIHATHLDAGEIQRLANSGAVAGLCPITEANLGDGIFPGAEFIAQGGRYGIGTDSNVLIGAAAELRQLEYAQRLGNQQRNVLASGPGSTGRALFDAAIRGGGQALGTPDPAIAVGAPADIVTLDASQLPGTAGDRILDAWIFAGLATVADVWVRGRHIVKHGCHIHREHIASVYQRVLCELSAGT
jgi:formiminoglutamate deiminase